MNGSVCGAGLDFWYTYNYQRATPSDWVTTSTNQGTVAEWWFEHLFVTAYSFISKYPRVMARLCSAITYGKLVQLYNVKNEFT